MVNVGSLSQIVTSTACAMVLLIGIADQASAEIRIKVVYDFIDVEIAPKSETHHSHGIDEYSVDGDRIIPYNGNSNNTLSQFGNNPNGLQSDGTDLNGAKIATSHSFTLKIEHENDYRITTIETDGISSCQAHRIAALKPDKKYFITNRKSNNEIIYESDQHWENMTCTIENQ